MPLTLGAPYTDYVIRDASQITAMLSKLFQLRQGVCHSWYGSYISRCEECEVHFRARTLVFRTHHICSRVFHNFGLLVSICRNLIAFPLGHRHAKCTATQQVKPLRVAATSH